jgi:hypothetical protein
MMRARDEKGRLAPAFSRLVLRLASALLGLASHRFVSRFFVRRPINADHRSDDRKIAEARVSARLNLQNSQLFQYLK